MLRGGALLNDEILLLLSTEAQLCAHLLVELGVTPSYSRSVIEAATHAFVYGLRNYCLDHSFGPYLSDGSCRLNWVMQFIDLCETELFSDLCLS